MPVAKDHPTLRLEFEKLHLDPPETAISNAVYAFTNIEADLRICLGERLFVEAERLCVVEFAAVVAKWLASREDEECGFRFESADDEEPNIFSLRLGDGGFEASSGWQKFAATTPLETGQTVAELARFTHDVAQRCENELGIAVGRWIESRRG